MGMAYFGPFDVADPRLNLGTITLKATGKPDVVVDMTTLNATSADGTTTSSVFWQFAEAIQTDGEDIDQTQHLGEYVPLGFADALEAALQAQADGHTWSATITVTLSLLGLLGSGRSLAYLIDVAGATLTHVNFSTADGAALLGFTGNWSGTSPAIATEYPNFVIVPTLQSTSAVNGADAKNYEPDGIASQAVSDSGKTFGLARPLAPIYRDWVQQYETLQKTFHRSAVAAHPYSFERLVKDCRTVKPFVVFNGFGASGEGEAFMLREDGAAWGRETCQRASEANGGQFHINFRAVVQGVAGASWIGGGGG